MNLGFMYGNGRGVAEDKREAVRWYRKAAEHGLASAQNNLGAMYDNGEGVPKNLVLAYAWVNLAAAQGNTGSEEARAQLETMMTPAQIAEAQQLSLRDLFQSAGVTP